MLQQVFTKNSLQADAISAAQHRNTLSEKRERILVLFQILWGSASHYRLYQRWWKAQSQSLACLRF